MRTTPRPFYLVFLLTISAVVLAFSSPAYANDITEVVREGVLHVLNPEGPSGPPVRSQPDELWRLGGDDEEDVIFGVIGDVAVDRDGNVYLLDVQLNEILVFDADGEYLRSIGREGEGPGEFRRPAGMFLTAAGDVAVVQMMPGKIVLLTADGEPAGTHPVKSLDDGVQFFTRAARSADQIAVSSRRFKRRDNGADITESLLRIDANGDQTATYMEVNTTREFTSTEMDEKSISGTLVWSVAAGGRVYASDNFDAYSITVWDPDGAVNRVIERQYNHRVRTDDEKERRVPVMGMGRRRGGRGRPRVEIKASDTDRDIVAMYPRNAGVLWVLSSSGAYDTGDGTMAVFDVFDADGRFTSQIELAGEGNFDRDEFHVAGDRLYVVTNVRAARRALRGATTDEVDETEEAALLAVICYDLAPGLPGSL
jgi:hypothetical protein